MDVIRLRIEFDNITLTGDFTSEETAYDWAATTLRWLLHEYGITPATRIAIMRQER